MASGTINGSTSNEYIDCKIVWSSVVDEDNNRSKVTATLYYKRSNTGFTTSGTGTFHVFMHTTTTGITITEHEWAKAHTSEHWVSHNDDGTGSVYIGATGSISGTTLTSTTCGATVTLDTIPRASTITSVTNTTIGSGCSIKWTPLSTSFKYRVKLSMGDYTQWTSYLSPNSKSAYTCGMTVGYTAAEELPKTAKGTMTATLYTYKGTTQIGSSSSKTFTVTVPNNGMTQPSLSATISPISAVPNNDLSTVYVQSKSKVKATVSTEGKYGATISSCKMTVLGKSYGSPFESGWLSQSGSVAVKFTATDSRGFSTTISKTITVIPYSKPKVLPASGEKAIVCARCDENGNLSESGTYLKIKAVRSFSTVTSGGVQLNKCILRYRHKTVAATSFSGWVTLLSHENTSDNTANTNPIANVVASTSTSYTVQISATDIYGESALVELTVPTDSVTYHMRKGGKAWGFGKYAERDNCLDISDDWDVLGRVYSLGKGKTDILSGADVNNYKQFGLYEVVTNAVAANVLNLPLAKAGKLIVSSANGTGQTSGKATYILQEYIDYTGTYKCRRMLECNASNEWTYHDWIIESDTGWESLGLSSNVSDGSNTGRNGVGCYYRVINENHVYVAFNCGFTYSGATVQVNANAIPSTYRPKRHAYAINPTGGRAIARTIVTNVGNVVVDWIQVIPTTESTTSSTVNWIDGYIDYWV